MPHGHVPTVEDGLRWVPLEANFEKKLFTVLRFACSLLLIQQCRKREIEPCDHCQRLYSSCQETSSWIFRAIFLGGFSNLSSTVLICSVRHRVIVNLYALPRFPDTFEYFSHMIPILCLIPQVLIINGHLHPTSQISSNLMFPRTNHYLSRVKTLLHFLPLKPRYFLSHLFTIITSTPEVRVPLDSSGAGSLWTKISQVLKSTHHQHSTPIYKSLSLFKFGPGPKSDDFTLKTLAPSFESKTTKVHYIFLYSSSKTYALRTLGAPT
jgi:hypothetical protein